MPLPSIPSVPPQTSRQRIMVVDDEEPVLRSTELLLNVLGYEAITLYDVRQVVEVAAREHPDLILQDLKMKNLDLPGLVGALRANPATSKIPLVFFSAREDVAALAAEQDAAGFLPKPFGEQQLTQLLTQTLGPKAVEVQAGVQDAMRREVREHFHNYWNGLTALSTYAKVLMHSGSMDAKDRDTVEHVDKLLLTLEQRTQVLRARLLALIG